MNFLKGGDKMVEKKIDKYHTVDMLGIKYTKLVDHKTGERLSEGSGWTYEESDEKALENLYNKLHEKLKK